MNSMNSATIPHARTAVDVDAAETALAAGAAAAALVPSTLPLVAVAAGHNDIPAGSTALVASFVGSPSAEIVLVADAVIADALQASAAAGNEIDLSDALRPAMEAAAAILGAGVLEAARLEPVEQVVGSDTHVIALEQGGDATAWFALRIRATKAAATPAAGFVPTPRANMRMLYDVEMTLTAEIGRTRLPVRQLLDLAPGAVLELDRTAGSPADVMVNGRLIARGEVVVVDEAYGIKVTEIVSGTESGA